MKKIFLELLACIFILAQLFVTICYLIVVFKDFSVDNLVILLSAIGGLYFFVRYINK